MLGRRGGCSRRGLLFGECVFDCRFHRHSPPLLPSFSPRTLLQLGAGSEQVWFFQRAQGRLQGNTHCFAQRLCCTEQPRRPLGFTFGPSVAGQSFKEHESAQRSAQVFGEGEALFVQSFGPLKVTAQESHPPQGGEWYGEKNPISRLPAQCCGFFGERRRRLKITLEQVRKPQAVQARAEDRRTA